MPFRSQLISILTYFSLIKQIDSGGPNARLKVFIDTIVRESRIQPPSGTLPPNFW